jgi:exoribonuclease R
MSAVQLKGQITTLLNTLPAPKLATVFDFVQFLTERELQTAWMSAQSQSAAYQEWLGSDNDVYDEVFADAVPTR